MERTTGRSVSKKPMNILDPSMVIGLMEKLHVVGENLVHVDQIAKTRRHLPVLWNRGEAIFYTLPYSAGFVYGHELVLAND